MRIFGVVAFLVIIFSGLASAAKGESEVRDGLTIAELGVGEAARLDANNPVLSLPVTFSPEFQQGANDRWLMFRIHFRITYPLIEDLSPDAISDIQHVLSVSIGSSTAVQIVVKREGDRLSANGIGWAEGSVTEFSTSDSIEMTYSNYFPEYLFPEDDTELRLNFEVSERARDAYAEVFSDSGFIETRQSPNSLVLEVLDIDVHDGDDGAVLAVIIYSIVNERAKTADVELVFIEDSGKQIQLRESKRYTILGHQSVQGEAAVPIRHSSSDLRGNLVVISDEFNSPSVAIELLKEPGPSYTVHILGLAIGGVLLICGSLSVVYLANKRMKAKPPRFRWGSRDTPRNGGG